MKDFVENALVTIAVISAFAGMFAPLFFREGGLFWGTITRKTIIVMFICFEIFIFAGMIGISINDPSKTLTAVICIGGLSIILGLYFAVLYERLPHTRQKYLWLKREREKFLGLERERQENLRKDNDGDDSGLPRG
jgi:hypothetical protein